MFRARTAADRSLAQRLSHAFIVVALLISVSLAIAATAFVLVLAHFEPSISVLIAGHDHVDDIRKGMLDEETGLRGYFDTGDTTFLQPYTAGRQEIASGEAGLVGLAMPDDLAGAMLDMRVAERAWLDEWATPALSTASSTMTDTQHAAFLLTDKRLFDSYRTAQALVDGRFSADIAAERAVEHNVVVIGAGLAGVALLATTVVARRQHRGLSAAMVEPVANLLSTMRLVRGGDLTARPAGIGPPELREVAADLAQMTDTLVGERFRIAALERHARSEAERLHLIVAVGREIAGSLSVQYVSKAVAQAAIAITGFDAARTWLLADDVGTFTAVHDTNVEHGRRIEGDSIRLGEGLVGAAGQHGRALSTGPDGSLAEEHRADIPAAVLAVPMIVGVRVVGVLELTTDAPRSVDEPTLDIIRSLAGQAATAVEAARLHQRADEMSHTDALTNLPNRRRLETDLEAEIARSVRFQRPLAFIMLDIDHFKALNDTHGHQAGDEILADFGRSLADALRETDTAYRYGGEEFSVLLRETDPVAAAAVAERLRTRIADRFTGSLALTASLGVAALPDDAVEAASLIAAADRALYAAKESGRNCVVQASHLPPRGVALRPVISRQKAIS
ncbi:MAG TPA: diguanylate cyclase [Candidatus Dormibacteraeota bacterium]|jgi:diguanylate cyclase (GGDEF)-like protein